MSPAPASSGPALAVTGNDGHCAELALVGQPDSAGPGLLWLPALGVPARKYRAFATALAEQGWLVALHEWRGQASSNRRAARDSDWGYAELLQDIRASRDLLQQQPPQRRWIIGGHSLGGQLAALAFAQQPAAYAGYLVAGSGQPWWRSFPPLQGLGLLAAIAAIPVVLALYGYFPGDRFRFGGREARGVMRDWARSALHGDYRPERVAQDLEALLAAATGPALALRLVSDSYAPAGSLEHLLAKLRSLQIQRADIADAEFAGGCAGHFDWMRDPLPLVRRIDSWARELGLAAVAPARSTADG